MVVKITVDYDKCQGYGQCVFEAEDVFHLDEQGYQQNKTEADESRREDIMRAADVCPMQAITVE